MFATCDLGQRQDRNSGVRERSHAHSPGSVSRVVQFREGAFGSRERANCSGTVR